MEKSSKEFDIIANRLVGEAGLENPSAAFTVNVMKAIAVRKSEAFVYKPLISRTGWWVITAVFVLSIALLYLLPLGGSSYFPEVKISELIQLENPFTNFKLSKPTIYGIGALALFIVQIPFLKKLIEKPLAS